MMYTVIFCVGTCFLKEKALGHNVLLNRPVRVSKEELRDKFSIYKGNKSENVSRRSYELHLCEVDCTNNKKCLIPFRLESLSNSVNFMLSPHWLWLLPVV